MYPKVLFNKDTDFWELGVMQRSLGVISQKLVSLLWNLIVLVRKVSTSVSETVFSNGGMKKIYF